MKFLTYAVQDQPRLGMLLDDDRVLDLTALLASRPDLGLPGPVRNVNDLIALGDDIVARVCGAGLLDGVDTAALPRLADVRELPPLAMARNVFCVGRNYREHIIEGNLARGRPADAFPEAIEFFTKAPTAVVGHGADVITARWQAHRVTTKTIGCDLGQPCRERSEINPQCPIGREHVDRRVGERRTLLVAHRAG